MTPILDRLERLRVLWVPTVTSLDALTGSALESFEIWDCPVADLDPLATLRSLKWALFRDLLTVNLAPLATLPHLRELRLENIEESVDLLPLAQMDHRLRVELWNTPTVGEPGPLVKVRRR